MPVRKTESRLPPNFQVADFGEAVVAPDGRCALVSFVTAPIVVDRENAYVLFATDTTLAGTAQSFEVHCLHEPLLDHCLSDFHGES